MTKEMFNRVRACAWNLVAAMSFWMFFTTNGRRYMKGWRELVMNTVEFRGEWNRTRLTRLSKEARAVYRIIRRRSQKNGKPNPFRLDNGVLWLPGFRK